MIIQDIFYTNTKRILQLQRTLEEALSLISSGNLRAGHQMQLMKGYIGLVTILSWSLHIRDKGGTLLSKIILQIIISVDLHGDQVMWELRQGGVRGQGGHWPGGQAVPVLAEGAVQKLQRHVLLHLWRTRHKLMISMSPPGRSILQANPARHQWKVMDIDIYHWKALALATLARSITIVNTILKI